MTRLPLLGIALVSAALPVMAAHRVLATASRPVELGSGPTCVALIAPENVDLTDAARGRRVFISLQGLRIQEQPGVLYRLYLNVPKGSKPTKARSIGYLNFFDAAGTGHLPRVFEIPADKRKLIRDENTITIVPGGTPAKSAKPVIEKIELIAD